MSWFFKDHLNYQKLLEKYSYALTRPMADLDRFSRLAPYLLSKSMLLSGASFMVLDREEKNYIVRAGEKDAAETIGCKVAQDSPLIQRILKERKIISLEEVEKDTAVAAEMRRLKAVLMIPSITEGEYFKQPTLLATINLGRKLSRQPYTQEDKNFLITLSHQASISIEYAFIMEELKKNQARVVQSEKMAAIGTTTAGIAHELKNPLTYISTLAQVLPNKWDDPEFRKSVNEVLPAETQRMQLIVEGLLDYARSHDFVRKAADIKDVIEKVILLLAYESRKKNVTIRTDYRHSGPISMDPNRMIQVFMNLIANAVQAMGEGGGSIIVSTAEDGKNLRIAVSDTGSGIPTENLNKLFDLFYTTKETGNGLGLAIVKKIIDEHKGEISVKSTVGRGTTFNIVLPKA